MTKELLIFFLISLIAFFIFVVIRIYGRLTYNKKYARQYCQTYSDEYISKLLKTKNDKLPNHSSIFMGENEKKDFNDYLKFIEMDFFKKIFEM